MAGVLCHRGVRSIAWKLKLKRMELRQRARERASEEGKKVQ